MIGVPTLVGLTLVTLAHVLLGGDVNTTNVAVPIAGAASLAMGLLLVVRLPRHPISWIQWSGGLLLAITVITQALADRGLSALPVSVPGAIWFAWLASWVGLPALFTPMVLLPLLYPSGEPISPRWRIVVRGAMATIGVWSVATALSPFPPGSYPTDVRNPLEVKGVAADAAAAIPALLAPVVLILLVLALGSLVVRYRRTSGVERQQIRWFVFVGAIAIAALLVAGAAKGFSDGPGATIDNVAWLVGIGALAFMPVAIASAILRYRLYEIDRVISRTIGWAVVTGLLAAFFIGAVLALEALLAPVTSENTISVAASTLLTASLFQPLRRRVQARVDSRFNRLSYAAAPTLEAFVGRLRNEVDLDELVDEIRLTVGTTVAPATLSLWIRE